MKKILITAAVIFGFQPSHSQIVVTKTRMSVNNSNDYLHRIANDFANEVGVVLRKRAPSRVENTSVKLTVRDEQLCLTYTAKIVSCTKEKAQHHFDHRGALSASTNQSRSLHDARTRSYQQKNKAEKEFKRVYGNAKCILSSDCTKYKKEWWTIQEFFITDK